MKKFYNFVRFLLISHYNPKNLFFPLIFPAQTLISLKIDIVYKYTVAYLH